MVDLSTFSTEASRRLDDTYYSVLEKLGVLQSTVVALRELAGMSAEMNSTFDREARELAHEVESQLNGFGGLADQQARIEALQGRVRRGRAKVAALSGRVDAVRDRIEGWERADAALQERSRRRLRAIWVVVSAVVLVLALLFAGAHHAPPAAELEQAIVRFANESFSRLRNATSTGLHVGEGGGGGSWDPGDSAVGEGMAQHKTLNLTAEKPEPQDGEALRVFDEL